MITPFYDDGTVALYLGDMREVLPALGVRANLVVADPPYAETSLAWDRWPDGWPALAATVSSSMWCFGSMRMFLDRRDDFTAWRLSQDVIWEKHNGSGFATDRFRRVHETALHWYRGAWRDRVHAVPRVPRTGPKVNGVRGADNAFAHTGAVAARSYNDDGTRLARSVLQVRSTHRHAIHPSQKPVDLLRPLIEYACPPGGLILDPFAGSGATLEAARLTGRRAIGIERHEPYLEAAALRLAQAPLEIA